MFDGSIRIDPVVKNGLTQGVEKIVQDETQPQSRLPGFYTLPAPERKAVISRQALLSDLESECLAKDGALGQELSDTFIENSIGSFELPLGIATNFRINQADVLVPMAVEESSVVAAAVMGLSSPVPAGALPRQYRASHDRTNSNIQ